MRTRVAAIVTLFALIFLGFVLYTSCSDIAAEDNNNHSEALHVLCQGAGATLEEADSQARISTLTLLTLENKNIVGGYYNSDGSVNYVSDGGVLPLTNEDIAAVRPDAVNLYTRNNAEGEKAIYAIYQFDDGAFLLFSREYRTGWDILFKTRAFVYFCLMLIAFTVYIVMMIRSLDRKEKLVANVMHSLDAFSEGKFDSRVAPLTGKQKDVEVYNAVMGRIQDRVLKQASRNHALNVVMNQMQNGIIAVDESLNVILITPVAKKLLGIIGNPEGRQVSDTSKDVRLDDVFNEAMRQGGVYTNEVAARTAVGRGHRPLRLYVSPMRNDGKVVGALAMVEDITEIRRLEQVRTDFAANVSHELKTPLTSIRGFVETLQEGAIDNPPMAHKFLRIIMMETERLTRLINDILSISKLESGDTEVSTERIRLDKMAYDVADMLSIHASEKEISINCHMNHEPVNIIGNPDRVEQMLINLIENGIKYNKPGGSVTVQVFSNGEEANITISDTGIGIAEENLPRLFERFYRVDKGRSRQMGGTGLGLAIVKHIVRSMGGEIEVHSKLNEGTEFLITLPLAAPDSSESDNIFGDDE